MMRSEEKLRVATAQRERGRMRLREYVVTENVEPTLPVRRKDEFVSSARDATPESSGEAGQHVTDFAKQNSAALIAFAAFGAGLLIGKRRAR